MLKLLTDYFTTANSFYRCACAIIVVYLAQLTFKISKTWHDKTFDWKKLIDGIISYAMYFVGVIFLFFAGELMPDMKFSFFGNEMTLKDGLTLLAFILFAMQVKNALNNIIETFKIKKEDAEGIEVNDKEAFIPTKYNEETM